MGIRLNPFTGQFDLVGSGTSPALQGQVDDLIDLTGLPANSTDLGPAAGDVVPDNATIKEAIDALDVNATNTNEDVADLITLSGVPANSTDLGTFSGDIIPDNSDNKEALQALESAIEALPNPITYQGTWDASTNTPTLSNGTGTSGYLYQVAVAGTVDFGAGPISFEVNDKVVFNGTVWEKWDQTDAVTSVNGEVGDVILDTDDIDEGVTNLYFTEQRVQDTILADLTPGTYLSNTDSVVEAFEALDAALDTKAPSVTYTTQLVLFGDGDTTPTQDTNFRFEPTVNRLNVGNAASTSDGIIVVGGSGTGIGTISGGGGALNIDGGPLTLSTHSVGQDITIRPGNSTAMIIDTDLDVTITGDVTAANLSGTNTGDQTITLTGDVTGSGTGSFATTIADTIVTPGSYGTATQVSSITVNSQGRLTAASNTAIAIPSTQVTDFNEASQDAVGGILTTTQTVALTYNDAGPSITADAITQMSITSDAQGLMLSGDASTPGSSYYYGTNGGGTKGWFPLIGGSGDIAQTTFAAANNQAAPTNITGLAFSNASIRSFSGVLSVSIDGTVDLFEEFNMHGIQKGALWEMAVESVGDQSGIELSITTAGQVQYTSTNVAGFVSNTMKFRATVTNV